MPFPTLGLPKEGRWEVDRRGQQEGMLKTRQSRHEPGTGEGRLWHEMRELGTNLHIWMLRGFLVAQEKPEGILT